MQFPAGAGVASERRLCGPAPALLVGPRLTGPPSAKSRQETILVLQRYLAQERRLEENHVQVPRRYRSRVPSRRGHVRAAGQCRRTPGRSHHNPVERDELATPSSLPPGTRIRAALARRSPLLRSAPLLGSGPGLWLL